MPLPIDNNIDAQVRPDHYKSESDPSGNYETIKVIFAIGDGPAFCRSNALKYVMRAGKKPGVPTRVDLAKAIEYLRIWKESLEIEKD